MSINEQLFYFLNSFALQNDILDLIILFAAEYLGWVLLVGLLSFIFTHRHNRREGFKNVFVILSTAVFAWVVAKAIKYGLDNPRPFQSLENVNMVFEYGDNIFEYGDNDSLPSGHATFFAAIATAVFFYHKQLGALYILGAVLIGLARIAGGVHFPTDILAGYALGGLIGYAAYKIYHLQK